MFAALLFALFCLGDGILLWALPHLQLSYAPAIGLPLMASLLVRSLVFAGLSGALVLSRLRGQSGASERPARPAVALFLVANVCFSLVQLDAYIVEPLLVEVTELSLASADLDPALPPVRVVHLTDTHVERYSFREADTVRRINALQPDLIVLTGDYLNLSYLDDPVAADHFRRFVTDLVASHGIYAVRGSVEPVPEAMARLLDGTEVVWLEQEAVVIDVRGQRVTLVGVACSHQQELDARRLAEALKDIPADAFTLLLYHSPDLILEAAGAGVDLYLAGHTHGGQIRLPLYGPIATGSRYGWRYAAGLFQEKDTTLYVSRGLGFEGGGMPRARFLCRPEAVNIELTGRVR